MTAEGRYVYTHEILISGLKSIGACHYLNVTFTKVTIPHYVAYADAALTTSNCGRFGTGIRRDYFDVGIAYFYRGCVYRDAECCDNSEYKDEGYHQLGQKFHIHVCSS